MSHHAQPQQEQTKMHGDVLEQAMEDFDRHITESPGNSIPMPENGGHARSAAAHLGSVHEHTKPQGNLRQGAAPGELREPPQQVSRVGKSHRGQ